MVLDFKAGRRDGSGPAFLFLPLDGNFLRDGLHIDHHSADRGGRTCCAGPVGRHARAC